MSPVGRAARTDAARWGVCSCCRNGRPRLARTGTMAAMRALTVFGALLLSLTGCLLSHRGVGQDAGHDVARPDSADERDWIDAPDVIDEADGTDAPDASDELPDIAPDVSDVTGDDGARDVEQDHVDAPDIGADVPVDAGGPLFVADFTTLTPGRVSALPAPLLFERASVATVQTGSSVVVTSGISVNVPRAGRRLDADSIGLLIEEARTNVAVQSMDLWNPSWASFGSAMSGGTTTSPDGTTAGAGILTDGSPIAYAARYAVIPMAGLTSVMSTWQRWQLGSVSSINFIGATSPSSFGTTSGFWERLATSPAVGTAGSQIAALAGTGNPLSPADVGSAAFWGMQLEAGAWASELIPTGSSPATRAGERLYSPSVSSLVSMGRLSMRVSLRPKASTADYQRPVRLWTIDATNYCEITPSGVMSVVIAGVTNTTSALAWAQYDALDIFVAAGGSIETVVSWRVNGAAATTASVTGPPLGVVSASGSIDLLCSGTASQFSVWLGSLAFYPRGTMPPWP